MRDFTPQKQILVIQPDQDSLDELKEGLKDIGLEIRAFTNGIDALNSLKNGFPDFILTPYNATGYEGNKLVDSLAKLGLLRHIPVIVTGHESVESFKDLDVFLKNDPADIPNFVMALAS